jgi:hypothetical protein
MDDKRSVSFPGKTTWILMLVIKVNNITPPPPPPLASLNVLQRPLSVHFMTVLERFKEV